MNILDQKVLKLNRLWQTIGETSVRDAVGMAAIDVATFLYISGDEMRPVKWEEWISLPVDEVDGFIKTQRINIRRPTVMVCLNYDKVPKRRPKVTLANIARRDGYKCQYTGETLKREDWSLDHVMPRCRGGKDTPDNLVLASRRINSHKGGRLPIEAGLPFPVIRKLLPEIPRASHPHHEIFLGKP